MTKQEVFDFAESLSPEEQSRWLIDLGMFLTIAARSDYPIQGEPGSISRLIAFNEMQHAVYGHLQHRPLGNAWPIRVLLDELISKAKYYQVEGDLGWAIRTTVERMLKSPDR